MGNIVYSFEFDERMFQALGIDVVDLSAFSGENDQFSGEYIADIKINNETVLYNQSVHLYTKDDVNLVCFLPELVASLPLKKQYINQLNGNVLHQVDAGECLNLEGLDDSINVEYDDNNRELHIVMPHVYLDQFDPYWIPPKKRDHGISGVFVDYSIVSMFDRTNLQGNRDSSHSLRSYGTIGANLGRFRLRADYQYDGNIKYGKKFSWVQRYGFTDIGAWNAKLYVGELYTRSNIFESTRIKGVSLFTDSSMMPSYLQGYAPEITGTANSNAVVTIMQYGNIIKTVQVPPGPFAIADLPSYVSGTVTVEIEESNGSKRTYEVDIAQVPFLTRKGELQYSVNMGKYSPSSNSNIDKKLIDTNVISADGSYGLTSNISTYGGILLTTNQEYKAFNLGLGFNLQSFGALSVDVTRSTNKAISNRTLIGHSYRFNYAKRFGEDTNLNLMGYRFSSKNYTTLNNYVDMKTGAFNQLYLEKNRFTLSITERLPSINSSVNASVTRGTYWNQKSTSSYNLSFNTTIQNGWFKNTSLQVSLSRYTNGFNRKNDQIALFVIIPLGDNYQEHVSYSQNYDVATKSMGYQATYYRNMQNSNMSMGVNAYHSKHNTQGTNYSVNGAYSYDSAYGQLNTSFDYADERKSATAGIDGSLTLTQHGLATQARVYGDSSRLIIDAGVPNVVVEGANGESNVFGLLGISNIPSYYSMTYKVDNDDLPDDVELQDSVVEVAVTDGAIAYRPLGAIVGMKTLTTITVEDGSYPPFGATVYRKNGKDSEAGMVADNGMTYLSGIKNHAEFIIEWGGDQSCRFKIESLNPEALKKLICYMEQ